MADLLKGKKLLSKNGLVDADEALKDMSVVLVYFSAHWCPPCKSFTPKLKDCFDDITEAGKKFTIIFVSSDRSEDEMLSYFKEHGDYFAIPFSDSESSSKLKTKCNVSGIPMLALVKPDGTMIYGDCRSDVSSVQPIKAYEKWEGLVKA